MADIELYELPENWIWTTLGEISTNPQYGYTTSASNEARGPKFLRITDLSSGSVNWDDVPYCAEPPDDIDKYLLFEGDIVIARSGSVGKAYLVKNPPEAVFASYLIRFRPILVFDRFVDAFLQTGFYFDQIADSSSGNTIFNVNAQKMRMLNIPLAPLDEQQRIVAEIERQFSRLDKWLEVMQKLHEQLPRLRASILKAAVEGRLVAQAADDEPADNLLHRILDERRHKWEEDYLAELSALGKTPHKNWKDRYQAPIPPDTDGLPDLPAGWVWASLDQLIYTIEAGKSIQTTNKPAEKGEYGILKVSAISWGEFQPEENKALRIDYSPNPRHLVKQGDLIISRANTVELVGAVVLVQESYENLLLSDKTLRLVPASNEVFTEYLLYSMRSHFVRNYYEPLATGTSDSMRNLSQSKILGAPIPLPPLTEQIRIIDDLSMRFSTIDRLEKTIEVNLKRAERMRQSVLKKAFEGRLVEQDPNNEPASQFLEQIREERQRRSEEEQTPKRQRERNVKIKTENMSLFEILREAKRPLSAHELFQQAGFTHETIDLFYKQLRSTLQETETIQVWRENDETFLKVVE